MTEAIHLQFAQARGFTLIEVLVFIIVTGLLMSTLLIGANVALRNTPAIHQQWVALQTARSCMEWYLGKRQLKGYALLSCPSTPNDSACAAPSGYTVNTQITCTTWQGDTTYKTITVTVSGLASVSLATQIGEY